MFKLWGYSEQVFNEQLKSYVRLKIMETVITKMIHFNGTKNGFEAFINTQRLFLFSHVFDS